MKEFAGLSEIWERVGNENEGKREEKYNKSNNILCNAKYF
jgi:hypothetical protein